MESLQLAWPPDESRQLSAALVQLSGLTALVSCHQLDVNINDEDFEEKYLPCTSSIAALTRLVRLEVSHMNWKADFPGLLLPLTALQWLELADISHHDLRFPVSSNALNIWDETANAKFGVSSAMFTRCVW